MSWWSETFVPTITAPFSGGGDTNNTSVVDNSQNVNMPTEIENSGISGGELVMVLAQQSETQTKILENLAKSQSEAAKEIVGVRDNAGVPVQLSSLSGTSKLFLAVGVAGALYFGYKYFKKRKK